MRGYILKIRLTQVIYCNKHSFLHKNISKNKKIYEIQFLILQQPKYLMSITHQNIVITIKTKFQKIYTTVNAITGKINTKRT